MSGSKEIAEQIVAELQDVADARIRAMMGGWLLYVDEILIGQINDDELFVKVTAFATSFAPDLRQRPPYSGAKPALVVDAQRRADAPWLRDLLVGTVAELRRDPRHRP